MSSCCSGLSLRVLKLQLGHSPHSESAPLLCAWTCTEPGRRQTHAPGGERSRKETGATVCATPRTRRAKASSRPSGQAAYSWDPAVYSYPTPYLQVGLCLFLKPVQMGLLENPNTQSLSWLFPGGLLLILSPRHVFRGEALGSRWNPGATADLL